MTTILIALLVGFVAGAFTTIGWACVWAAGDHLIDTILAPGFDAHADQAIANTVEPEVRS